MSALKRLSESELNVSTCFQEKFHHVYIHITACKEFSMIF